MWSGDSTTTPDELAAAAVSAGLDAIAITDHNTISGAQRLANSGELGLPVVVGQEIRTRAGDLIGLHLCERIPAGMTPTDAALAIRGQGGLVYAPHPGDESRHSLSGERLAELAAAGLLDVIEILNAKRQSRWDGETFGAAVAGASDCHVPEALGAGWTDVPDCDPLDSAALLVALRDGAVGGGYSDPPRRWAPRIIPAGLSGVRSPA
jgi:predicted metal-dependent phosphoesterase TrpH